jgi:K+/H+ antiporter YhaU regulatory subunit KhtT
MAGRGVDPEPEAPVAHRRRAGDTAGAQAVLEAPEQVRTLAGIYDLIPGLAQPVSLEIREDDYAAGRSLAQLDLRDATEATVLVIVRPSGPSILPVGAEVLQAGDLLALAGTAEAVAKAKMLLRTGRVQQSADAD